MTTTDKHEVDDETALRVQAMHTGDIERTLADLDGIRCRVHGRDPHRRRRSHLYNLLVNELNRRINARLRQG